MKKEFEDYIKLAIKASEPYQDSDVPPLKPDTSKLIAVRKKGSKSTVSVFQSIIERLFHANKIAVSFFVIITMMFLIKNTQFTTSEKKVSTSRTPLEDTVLSIPSSTFLATLHNNIPNQIPVNTSTALTCISTMVCKN